MKPHVAALPCLLLGACAAPATPLLDVADPAFATVAESSGWRATETHAETVALAGALAAASPRIELTSAGSSHEGRDLALLIVADPPVRHPGDVGDRSVVFAWGGIHSGEVCGKPATLMLARELAADPDPALLEDLVVLLLPLLNADGNERMAPDNRPGQVGPELGMGIRPNAQGLNINRDWSKLETPEARAVVSVLNDWDPLVAMDLHTTNGSIHRYALTHDGPRHPGAYAALREHVTEVLLPAVSESMLASSGYATFPYGNLNRARDAWRTYPAQVRYSTHYLGLRHALGILSEAYSYASYEDRVRATLEFVRHTFLYTAQNRAELQALVETARAARPDTVPLRQRSVARAADDPLLGYTGTSRDDLGEPTVHQVRRYDATETTLETSRPYAYLFPEAYTLAAETLDAHGIVRERLAADVTLALETYRVQERTVAEREYEGHRLLELSVAAEPTTLRLPAGTVVVRTAQPLGALAAHLLEPQAEDGLVTWGAFDEPSVERGRLVPVYRLVGPRALPLDSILP